MQTNNTKQAPDDMPLTPDEIKAIGEIELGPAKHEVFLNKHYKKLIFGGIAIAVLATAATAWYAHGEQQKEEAGALVVKAVGATVTDTSLSPQNYDAAALDEVIADYADTPSAETAQLLKAMREITDPAYTDFSALVQLAESAENDMVRLRAIVSLASRFTKDGDYEKAALYWQRVISLPRNVYTPRAYVNLCDIAWNQGNTEKAADYLNQAREACPDSELFDSRVQNDISVRFDLLESGVDSPEIVAAPVETPAATVPAASTPAADDIFTKPLTTDSAAEPPALPENLSTLPTAD